MTVSSEIVVDVDGWRVKKLFEDRDFSHYVLNVEMDKGHSSTPFDEVRASGGLLHLNRNGERSETFTGVVDGANTYLGEEADMPREVFEELKQIGPY